MTANRLQFGLNAKGHPNPFSVRNGKHIPPPLDSEAEIGVASQDAFPESIVKINKTSNEELSLS